MRKKPLTEIKVGIVVLIGILLLFYMSFKVGKMGFLSEKGYELFLYLDDASGLDQKTPVRLAGVEIGRIKEIALEDFKAKITLFIREGILIPVDSKVYVKSEGILGDRYIEVIPGGQQTTLKAREAIKYVEKYPDFDEIFKNLNTVSKNVNQTLTEFKDFFTDKEKLALKKTIKNFETFSSDMKSLISENKGELREVVTNTKKVSEKLAELTENVEKGEGTLGLLLKDESLYYDSKEAVASIKEFSSKLDKGSLGKLLEDESLYTETKKVVKDLGELTEGIKKGEGTLGKMIKDEEIYTETKKTLKDIQKAARGVEEQTPVSVIGTIMRLLF